MRLIGAWSHAIIDYVMVIILVIGPGVAGFSGRQATLAYVLAATIFVLSLLTRYPLGVMKVLGFPVHGALELLIAILVLILPWLASFARGVHSRDFYVLIAILLLVICLITDYRGLRGRSADREGLPK